MKGFLHARNCASSFTRIVSFNLPKSLPRRGFYYSIFYPRGNWGSETWNNLAGSPRQNPDRVHSKPLLLPAQPYHCLLLGVEQKALARKSKEEEDQGGLPVDSSLEPPGARSGYMGLLRLSASKCLLNDWLYEWMQDNVKQFAEPSGSSILTFPTLPVIHSSPF